MLKRLSMIILLLCSGLAIAQDDPVPTLVPPTPLPVSPTAPQDALLSESTVSRVVREGNLRVGVLYNEPAMGELRLNGDIVGYDADLARAIADVWNVELELVQVTRLNRFDKLQAGDVDLLMAAVVHQRAHDAQFSFSQTYRLGKQAMMIPADDDIRSPFALANRPVGYVIGTPAEVALNRWIERTRVPVQPRPYLTLDQAYRALFGGEIAGLVGRDSHLLRISANDLDAVTIFDDAIAVEAYGIVMRRQDAPMRNLINRTLQYLLTQKDNLNADSTLEQLHSTYLPNDDFPFDALPIYANVGSAPSLATYNVDIAYPQLYAVPRVRQNNMVRVAGLIDGDGLPESQARVAQINRAIAERIAERWGVRVEFVAGDPIELVASGQADMAIGIAPDWSLTNQIDFTQPYLLHGDRLLIPTRRDYERFGDLRNRIVATVIGDEGARDRADAWADSIGANVRGFETFEESIARTLLQDNNADAVFGDSLLLIPHLQRNPDDLRLGPAWYSREYIAVAVPDNDPDFRNLVNYTLQEIARDQTLDAILAPVTAPDEASLRLDIWSGSAQYLGFTLTR